MAKLERCRSPSRPTRRAVTIPWIRRPASTRATTTSISPRSRPTLWQSRLPRALAERGPRVVDARRQSGLGVRRPRHRPQRERRRRARRRRSSARSGAPASRTTATAPAPEAAARGHGPRRPVGVGDLRTARARPPDRRSRRCRTRASRHGTTGRSRSSTRSLRIGCACSRSCPATPPRPPRPSSSAARRSVTGARSSASSTSTSATRPGIACGPPRRRPASRSASTSRAARRRSSATGSASGSRPRSRRCCRCSSTSRWRPWCSAARSNGTPAQARARGVGHRLAAVLPRAHGPRVAQPARQARLRADASPPSELFRRQVMATFEEDALAAQLIPHARRRLVHVGVRLSAHRQHVPELAARDRGDARRAARRGRRKITATNCARLYGFADALTWRRARSAASTTCRCRCSTPTRWSRSTARSGWTSPSIRTSCPCTSATR